MSSTDEMTLDELIAEVSAVQLLDDIETLEALTDAIIELIDANRPALEAGMRGTLRFCRGNNFPKENEWWYLVPIHDDNAGADSWCAESQIECVAFANALGLTAVFVEDDDD